jgi:hypothetical protein
MIREFIKDHRLAAIGIALIVVGLVGFTGYNLIMRVDKEPVTVHLIPSDTKLLVNNVQVSEGTTYLKPGTYTLKATRNGFESIDQKVIIDKPNKAVIDLALTPLTEAALKWQHDHAELYYAFEGRTATQAREEGEAFTAANPITDKLPFENFIYTIGYRTDSADASGNSIILSIDAATGYRNAAIDKIRELGYDPTNFKIEFNDYESPFDHE